MINVVDGLQNIFHSYSRASSVASSRCVALRCVALRLFCYTVFKLYIFLSQASQNMVGMTAVLCH